MYPKSSWRNYHIYYTDVSSLIMECVYPFLQSKYRELDTCFWERHYAAGPHLRVRMQGAPDALDRVSRQLVVEAEEYIAAKPSRRLTNYSTEKVTALLKAEMPGQVEELLSYRVDEILEVPYQRLKNNLASDEAARLLEKYLNQSMPLVVSICRNPQSSREQVLRLYFALALFVSGEIPRGCVSYKSHWEGFSSRLPTRGLVSRIKDQYEHDREHISEIMLSVQRLYRDGTVHSDPILAIWHKLLVDYKDSTLSILKSGIHITRQPVSAAEVRAAKRQIMNTMVDESEFMRALFEDDRFLALIQYDHNFLWPRVLTNLLYQTVASVGLHIIDKMALCYGAQRAAEEHFNCNLLVFLKETIATIVDQHAHQLVANQ